MNIPCRVTVLVGGFVLGITADAQTAMTPPQPLFAELRGDVRDARGPVIGVNVFVGGTLDGAMTDSLGHFTIRTPRRAEYLVVVQRLGYREVRIPVADSMRSALRIVLEPAPMQSLGTIVVEAGRFIASNEPGAVLTPLEVVTIPGTAADVNRALQTLPGVAQVDEGTALFVRGGDYTETRVFLNGGLLLNPAQLQRPAGSFVGSFDPFLLHRIEFFSGGFGVQYGDALSGVIALNTELPAPSRSATLSMGLAAISADVTLPGPRGTGVRVVTNRKDLTPVLRLNGSSRAFTIPPRGADHTASAWWSYRPTARITAFVTQQKEQLGLHHESATVNDVFSSERRDQAIVISWHDLFGRIQPSVSLSRSSVADTQHFGAFALASPQQLNRIMGSLLFGLGAGTTLRIGTELAQVRSRVGGSIPVEPSASNDGARVTLYDIARTSTTRAAFGEFELRPSPATHLVLGVRADRSTTGIRTTFDPRATAAWRPRSQVTLTAALGVYHQRPDPVLAAVQDRNDMVLPTPRAVHSALGLQVGDSGLSVRAEAFHKRYSQLVQQTRIYTAVAGGTGMARGIDLIARAPSFGGLSTRVVYSWLDAQRTDPDAGTRARAPFDVTHTLALIATQQLPGQISVGMAMRYATGRPFTPVVSATRATDDTSRWIPTYGIPASERLPAFARMDMSASWFRLLRPSIQAVGYVAITNALARRNVYEWRYSTDYRERHDVASIFNRSIYFGAVLTLQQP